MDEFIPREEWVAYVEPYYPSGRRGRPPMGIEKMLRVYLLQCWCNLSDEGIEDAVYDSYALRWFMKINTEGSESFARLQKADRAARVLDPLRG
jgi:IS5 family transposase